MKAYLPILASLVLFGCSSTHNNVVINNTDSFRVDSGKLENALGRQDDAAKARYGSRNPQETLEFFGIAPGMTVVEALPGGGWYSKVLLPYLGEEGRLVGVDYSLDMYPLFGFFSEEALEKKKTWTADWTREASGWRSPGDAYVAAFTFGGLPATMSGQADAVLFVRALHNLSRFENEGAYLSTAISDAMRVLKPGGIVGIVQHRAPADAPAASVKGDRGYMKQDDVIAFMRKAGFEYVGASEVNANPKDVPGVTDIVWRLPPSMVTSREDADLRKKMQSIGESDRMTLKFVKPM
ncbi:MAG: class I SAM-dependent methyltransferase [Gammaproteobacteria bacterium]